MSTIQNILRFINEDFAPPTVRLILVSQDSILINKIVSKKLTLHDILKEEGLKEGKNYLMFGKPVNLDKKILDLIPKKYSNLSNIELIIEEKNISLDEVKVFYEKILKPFENPFKILVFIPNEFNASIKTYSDNIIEKFKLNKFAINLSSYCNSHDSLYISGGNGEDYSSLNSGNKHFWKINSIKFNIEKLSDLPIDKQNHSMLYIPKRYIYFIGGNNKKTFFYDIFFSSFNSWANMNKPVKNPTLMLINNIFIHCFGNYDISNNENNFIFERTNLKSINPKWELKIVKNQILPIRNFGGIRVSDEIFFLGGRNIRGEKMFKFNTITENLEICKQENTKLKPLDKTFYDLNEFNSVMVPDCNINENVQIIIFNKKKKKYRKVLFEKNLEEIINNDNLEKRSLCKNSLQENEKMQIVWKEFKNNYEDKNILGENIISFPSIEELKKGKIVFKTVKSENDEIKNVNNKNCYNSNIINNNKEELINNNISGKENDIGNIAQNINYIDNLNQEEEIKNENPIELKNDSKNININNKDKENANLKMEIGGKINSIPIEDKIISSPNSISLKEVFNKDINNKINLKTEFIDFNPSKVENFLGQKTNKKNSIDENNTIDKKENYIEIKNNEKMNNNSEIIKFKENTGEINELEKDKEKINESQKFYKKKTIIKQDKNNEIVNIEKNEKELISNKLKNENNKGEKLKDFNTFNIEYNNEIIVGEKRGEMLSDIISNNSEIIREKTNKGLNNRFILNVSKSKKDEEKNNINIIKKYKEKINIEADNNVDSKSSKLSLREKSVKDMESISIKERNQNNEINSIQKNEDLKVKNNIEMNKNKKNEEALGSEKLIKENPKIETNGDIPESKKIRDNESSKVSNSYDIQSYNNNDQSEILLKDKIIYSNDGRKKENEIKKNDLNTVDSLKQNKSELVSGIINKIPEIKDINEIHNSKNEKDLDIKVNQNIPQTLN